jgi:uncharacterized membrane protein YcaP (DUF421 family)
VILDQLFGTGKELEWYQMGFRSVVVFLITLSFLRYSGSRAFGMRSPFDNVMSILLGAVLARTITGASEFLPTVFAAFVIALLHRFFAWMSLKSDRVGWLVKGSSVTIFENGKMVEESMRECLVTKKDLLESMRESGVETFDELKLATVERSGKISIVKK